MQKDVRHRSDEISQESQPRVRERKALICFIDRRIGKKCYHYRCLRPRCHHLRRLAVPLLCSGARGLKRLVVVAAAAVAVVDESVSPARAREIELRRPGDS